MRITAPAKLNLCLHVTGKRTDGYHLLHSLMAFTSLCDVITISDAKAFTFSLGGSGAVFLQQDLNENIIQKTVRLVAEAANIEPKISIQLEKNTPVGAGLGGGSADAGAMLRLLKDYWKLALPEDTWDNIALELGADVPFCYRGKAGLVQGIGEVITDVAAVPPLWAVLVNPNKPLSTQEVFKRGVKAYSDVSHLGDVDWSNVTSFLAWLENTKNDLQAPAIEIMPEIAEILSVLEKQDEVIFSRMSGSGATCFGLCSTSDEAHIAAQNIQKNFPHWWVKKVALLNNAIEAL